MPTGAGSGGGGLPAGAVQGRTDFGSPVFGGACPPDGAPPHRYIFTVYALPMESLPLDEAASGAMVGFYVINTALASARLTALYGR